MDRIWHCPNGKQVEMTTEEVEAVDFINQVFDEYKWQDDVEWDDDEEDLL